MPDFSRYYEILGLEPGCTPEELKLAWRDLVQVWHPDRFPANERLRQKAQDKLKEINEAFDALRDLKAGRRPAGSEPPKSGRREAQWAWAGPGSEAERDPLGLLKDGVHAWNLWRSKYSDLTPRLAGVRLPRGDYTGLNLREMDLSQSRFSEAALYKADLSRVTAANAVFAGSELNRATLIEAKLTRCDLSSADLSAADLSRARLIECNLTGAVLVATILDGAHLDTCRGLTAEQLEASLTDGSTRLPKLT